MGKKYISPRDEKNVQFFDKKSYFAGTQTIASDRCNEYKCKILT